MKKKILIIGGSSAVGIELIKEASRLGIDIKATYFQNRDSLFEYSESALYFNHNALASKSEIESLIADVRVVIDCSQSEHEVREDFIKRIWGHDASIKYVSLKQLSSDFLNNTNIISLKTGLVVGKGTKFDNEVCKNLSHGIVPLPIPTLSTGSPIHVKDLAAIILKLSIGKSSYEVNDHIVIEGATKITIAYTIKQILKSYDERYIFSFYFPKSWFRVLNEELREKTEFGFSNDLMDGILNFSKGQSGANALLLTGIKPLSIQARYIEKNIS